MQNRDLAAISPTGTGKTLSYLLPTMIALDSPNSKGKKNLGSGARAVILAPTRELAHQIHNECLKLAEGRKWRITLFSKATASTLADKNVRDKVGEFVSTSLRAFSFSCLGYCRHHYQYSATARYLTSAGSPGLEQVSVQCPRAPGIGF